MNDGFILVPKGKRVRFKQEGKLIAGTEDAIFLLEEDVTLTMSSSFSSVVKSGSPAFLSIASQEFNKRFGSRGAAFLSGQFKQFGFQTWTSTQPLSTSITLKVAMKTDAYKDVVVPTLALAKLCLPSESDSGGLIGPGPALSDSIKDEKDSNGELIDSEGETLTVGRQLHCYIGSYYLKNILLKSAQPTFSKYTDTNGYPISASIQVQIETLFSATTKAIDEMMKGI